MALVAVIGLLALFSIVSILLSAEDPRSTPDPRDNPVYWMSFARH